MMENGSFYNYDDKEIYENCKQKALDISTKNFVIEFGKDEAQIAFDLQECDFNGLLTASRPEKRPIRWM